jgi:hypothetical protein
MENGRSFIGYSEDNTFTSEKVRRWGRKEGGKYQGKFTERNCVWARGRVFQGLIRSAYSPSEQSILEPSIAMV